MQSSCKSVQKHKRVLPSFQKPRIGVQSLNKSFGLQNFVQTFGLQALQSKALYGGKTSRRRRQTFGLQALQSKALYGGKTSRHTKLTKRSFVQAL